MTDHASLFEALVAFQAEAPTLEKDRTVEVPTKKGGTYSYSYTPLDSIVEKIGPLLHKNQLAWLAKPSWLENVGPTLKYKLVHGPSHEFEEGEMPLILGEEADAQAMGSAITYMRRYALCSVLNLVADADDDGALASANGRRGGSSRPASPKQLDYVKSLLKRQKATVADIRAMLKGAGVSIAPDADPAPLVDALTGDQASAMIEFLKDGKPVPTGTTDVPADGGSFTYAPSDDGDLPFSPEAPQ